MHNDKHCHSAWNEAKRSGSAESLNAVYLFAVVVVVSLRGRFVARGNPETNIVVVVVVVIAINQKK
jgi:hypothetical protein